MRHAEAIIFCWASSYTICTFLQHVPNDFGHKAMRSLPYEYVVGHTPRGSIRIYHNTAFLRQCTGLRTLTLSFSANDLVKTREQKWRPRSGINVIWNYDLKNILACMALRHITIEVNDVGHRWSKDTTHAVVETRVWIELGLAKRGNTDVEVDFKLVPD